MSSYFYIALCRVMCCSGFKGTKMWWWINRRGWKLWVYDKKVTNIQENKLKYQKITKNPRYLTFETQWKVIYHLNKLMSHHPLLIRIFQSPLEDNLAAKANFCEIIFDSCGKVACWYTLFLFPSPYRISRISSLPFFWKPHQIVCSPRSRNSHLS